MLLEEIAFLFPNQISKWPLAQPAKALPFYLRTFLRNSVAKKISANDFNKKYFPHRLGVLTRNFQTGDPLKTLSRSHLLRLNSFVTKMDVSPGRKKILILFHCYHNMTYHSHFSKANKGQLAHAICAVIQQIHTGLSQNLSIKALCERDFFGGCKQLQAEIKGYEKIYFLSDFLFNSESIDACAQEILKTITYFNLKKSVFFILRDPLECPDSLTSYKTDELLPWDEEKVEQKNRYSDAYYAENLKRQVSEIQEKISSTGNFSRVMTNLNSLSDLLDFIHRDIQS